MYFVHFGERRGLSDSYRWLKATLEFLCLSITKAGRIANAFFLNRPQPSPFGRNSLATSRTCICSDDDFPKVVACRPLAARDQRMSSGAGNAFSLPPRRFLWEQHFLAEGSDGTPCTLAVDHGWNQVRKQANTLRSDWRNKITTLIDTSWAFQKRVKFCVDRTVITMASWCDSKQGLAKATVSGKLLRYPEGKSSMFPLQPLS